MRIDVEGTDMVYSLTWHFLLTHLFYLLRAWGQMMLDHMLEFVKCERTFVKYFTTRYGTAAPTEIECLGQPKKGKPCVEKHQVVSAAM